MKIILFFPVTFLNDKSNIIDWFSQVHHILNTHLCNNKSILVEMPKTEINILTFATNEFKCK